VTVDVARGMVELRVQEEEDRRKGRGDRENDE
jgi:hypothetical protein